MQLEGKVKVKIRRKKNWNNYVFSTTWIWQSTPAKQREHRSVYQIETSVRGLPRLSRIKMIGYYFNSTLFMFYSGSVLLIKFPFFLCCRLKYYLKSFYWGYAFDLETCICLWPSPQCCECSHVWRTTTLRSYRRDISQRRRWLRNKIRKKTTTVNILSIPVTQSSRPQNSVLPMGYKECRPRKESFSAKFNPIIRWKIKRAYMLEGNNHILTRFHSKQTKLHASNGVRDEPK